MRTVQFIRLVSLLFAAGIFSGCTPREVASKSEELATPRIQGDRITFLGNAPQLTFLKTEPVAQQKAPTVTLSGRLAWNDEVTARIFASVSGRIVDVLGKPGEAVSSGTPLARMRSSDFGQAQRDARKASIDEAQAARGLTRTRELVSHRAAAQKDVETAEADYERARSEKERALANLTMYNGENASSDVNGILVLNAPIAGTIVERTISPAQEVRADQLSDKPLFVISDPTRLWLYLDATDLDASAISVNQEVMIRSRTSPERSFHGRVEVIGESLDPATRTMKIRCAVDNNERRLRAEMYVDADVAAVDRSGIDVSTKALLLRDNKRLVFVEREPGVFQRRAVEVGHESNGRSLVVEGLNPGDRVVVDGALLLDAAFSGGMP